MTTLKQIIAITIFSTALISCRKESELDKLNNSIRGEWRLLYSVGGFSGKDTAMPASATKLIFKNSNSYTIEKEGVPSTEGKFHLSKISTIFGSNPLPAISFDPTMKTPRIIHLNNGVLTISDNHVEPYGDVYVRVEQE